MPTATVFFVGAPSEASSSRLPSRVTLLRHSRRIFPVFLFFSLFLFFDLPRSLARSLSLFVTARRVRRVAFSSRIMCNLCSVIFPPVLRRSQLRKAPIVDYCKFIRLAAIVVDVKSLPSHLHALIIIRVFSHISPFLRVSLLFPSLCFSLRGTHERRPRLVKISLGIN